MKDKRLNFKEPESQDECRNRIVEQRSTAELIRAELSLNKNGSGKDSNPEWRYKAIIAREISLAEVRYLENWLKERHRKITDDSIPEHESDQLLKIALKHMKQIVKEKQDKNTQQVIDAIQAYFDLRY